MAKAKPKLFTIGYEKAKPAAVLTELKRAKVKLLVDTRAVAASRKPVSPSGSLPPPSMRQASTTCICKGSARRTKDGKPHAPASSTRCGASTPST